jgi:hypothetical protein
MVILTPKFMLPLLKELTTQPTLSNNLAIGGQQCIFIEECYMHWRMEIL